MQVRFSILIYEGAYRIGKNIWRAPRVPMTTILVKLKDSHAYERSKLLCRLGRNNAVILSNYN